MLSKQLGVTTPKRSRGRPEDQQMGQYFKELCQWLDLEAGSEFHTILELHAKMVEFFGEGDDEVYTIKKLKQKLQEHHGECVFCRS